MPLCEVSSAPVERRCGRPEWCVGLQTCTSPGAMLSAPQHTVDSSLDWVLHLLPSHMTCTDTVIRRLA